METMSITELVDLLRAQGISRTRLAAHCGISYSTLANALAGRWIGKRTAQAIADTTGTRAVLVGGEFRFSGNVKWRQ